MTARSHRGSIAGSRLRVLSRVSSNSLATRYTGGTVATVLPGGSSVGVLLLIYGGYAFTACTTPSGWTLVDSYYGGDGASFVAFYSNSPSSAPALTVTADASGSESFNVAAIGFDGSITGVIASHAVSKPHGSGTGAVSSPSVTATAAALVAWLLVEDGNGAITFPGGTNNQITFDGQGVGASDMGQIGYCDKPQAASGATGTGAWSTASGAAWEIAAVTAVLTTL